MSKGKLLFIAALVAALTLTALGWRNGRPTPVEQVYLSRVDLLAQRGIENNTFRKALDEVKRYVEFALTEDAGDAGSTEAEADAALKVSMDQFVRINKVVEEHASKLMRQGKGKQLNQDGLAFIKAQVQESIRTRGLMDYALAACLGFLLVLTLTPRP